MTTYPTGRRPQEEPRTGPPSAVPPPLPKGWVEKTARPAQAPAGAQASSSRFDFLRKFSGMSRYAPHTRRVGKACAYTFVPILLLFGIAFAVIAVRLRHGPISFDLLVPPIERGINAELVNNQVDIEGAELRLGADGGLEFRLRNMNVLDSSGAIVANAPLSAVSISKAALWKARIVPERVTLIDPEIHLMFTEEHGLSLAVSAPPAKRGDKVSDGTANDGAAATSAAPETPRPTEAKAQPLNIARMLSEASHRARRQLDATSYLTEFGVQNATVVLDYAGRRSSWRIDDANIDFNHAKKRSVISGRAAIASQRGPWTISFLTDESEKTDRIAVKANVRDLVPSTLSAAAPPLALLAMFDMPISGDATVDLTTQGDIDKTEIALQAGEGRIVLPGVSADPFQLTAGLFRLVYDGDKREWQLNPSPVKWADGNIMFSGTAKDISGEKGPPVWRFSLDGRNGVLEAAEFNVPAVNLDQWSVLGSIIPRRGVVEIGDFRIKGGGGEIVMKGMTVAGPDGQSSRAEVSMTPMPLATLKAIWPRALAPGAREWVGERVSEATFNGASVRFTSGEFMKGEAPNLGNIGERLSATFEVADAVVVPLDQMVPVTAPRALIRLENNALEITVPEAFATLPQNRKVPIKAVRLASPDVVIHRPDSELTFTVQSQLGPFLEALESMPLRPVRENGPFPKAAEGKVDANFKLKIPLVSGLKAEEVGVEGKAKITDGRFGKVAGQFDVQGFTLALDLNATTLDAKGDLLINGVPAKVVGQHLLNADSATPQPPFKITANLDDADRNQLGLDINDLVRGTVAVDISMQKGSGPDPVVKLKANLADAELMLDAIGWKKPQGRSATLEADIAPGKTYKTELQNFKVAGDDIAIEGWLGIGADSKMKEFFFPEFTLNVVSRLEVQGTRGNDGIWNIKARGKTFDGRDFFKSLFTLNDSQKAKATKPGAGIDLTAEVDNVLGADDVSLKGLKLKLSSRMDKLSALDARGTLDGGAPLAAVVDRSSGARRLLADSTDAGTTMKLIGFYPNMQGGRLRLEVNLDGKGAAEKTGILWVDDFKVLGDPIVSEVVGSADQGRPAIQGSRKVTREVYTFDRMRAPFSVGYGQFVLEDAYVRGPMMGANLTGKADFKVRRINLGGTYIPLQGLNSALGGIPLLGQIISGTKGEGIFGITFGIQGSLDNPQVLVNPLSLVAPGIFREIFQMTNPNQKVQARDDKPAAPVENRVRASAPPAPPVIVEQPVAKQRKPKSSSDVVDGWSSTTEQN